MTALAVMDPFKHVGQLLVQSRRVITAESLLGVCSAVVCVHAMLHA